MKLLLIVISVIVGSICQEQELDHEDLTTGQAWGIGMLTGVGLIVFGLLIGWILQCIKDHISPRSFVFMVSLLYALACGQLIGDVMIHALPKVYQSTKTKMEIVALIVMSAICFFILIERTIKHCGNQQQPQGFLDHDHKDDDEDPGLSLHQHWQSFIVPRKRQRSKIRQMVRRMQTLEIAFKTEDQAIRPTERKMTSQHPELLEIPEQPELEQPEKDQPRSPQKLQVKSPKLDSSHQIKGSNRQPDEERHSHSTPDESEQEDFSQKIRNLGTKGILQAVAQLVTNLFDGFALGVAFGTQNKQEYVPVIFAVYAHCLPRELRDFAILSKSEFTSCQIKICSAVPKITTLIGVAIGLALHSTGEAAEYYILSFVAGNFIYLAADIWKNLFMNKLLWKIVLQVLFFALGVGIEYLVLLIDH